MELSDYLKILKKNAAFVLAAVLVCSSLGFFISTKIPSGFNSSRLFFLETIGQNTQNYDYDGYYGQEKARNFTDTAVSLLTSIDTSAELGPKDTTLDVAKLAPQLIKITAVSNESQNPKIALDKIAPAFNQKMQTIYQKNNLELIPANSASSVSFSPPNKIVLTIFGLILGLTASLAAIALKTFFKL